MIFRNFASMLRNSTLKWDLGSQNRYLCKLNNVLLRPTRELIFSLKESSLNVLTEDNRLGKNSYVEKNDLKAIKKRFFGYGNLTVCRQKHLDHEYRKQV